MHYRVWTFWLWLTSLLMCGGLSYTYGAVSDSAWRVCLGFLPNRGQLANELGQAAAPDWYLVRQPATIAVEPTRLAVSWRANSSITFAESGPAALVYRADLQLVGANPNATVQALCPMGRYFNFYHDHCPQGIVDVPDWRQIEILNVWPGIDWVLKATSDGLKYEFVLAPGADPCNVRLCWQGMDYVRVDPNTGQLEAANPWGRWEEAPPIAWQLIKGDTCWVPASFSLSPEGTITFALGDYQPDSPLIIDPLVRIWGTYYGGNLNDSFRDVVLDPEARYYFIGEAQSPTPALATPGTQQPVHGSAPAGGPTDVILAKFDVAGNLIWATFYGGPQPDGGRSLALDRDGNLYAAGYTNTSSGLMGTPNACQPTWGGAQDAFVAKFDPKNGRRVWSTYLGGSGDEQAGNDLSVDECGNILFIGTTASLDYRDSDGRLNTSTNALVVKLRNFHGGCAWRQFIGGSGIEEGLTIDVEGCGETRNFVLIGGSTTTPNDLATPGTHQTVYGGGASDGFLARLNNASGRLVWLTYLGGTGAESVQNLKVDGCSFVFATGTTDSPNALATAGSHQVSLGGATDAFVVKFDVSGQRLWGSYVGGSEADEGLSISVEGCDAANVYLAGRTRSTNGIASANAWQPTKGPTGTDGWVARFEGLTASRTWGSYLAGSDAAAYRVLKSWRSDVVVVGQASSFVPGVVGANPPANVHQPASGGQQEAFVILFTD